MRTNDCIVSQLNIFIYSVVKMITQLQKMFQLKFSRYHLYQFHRLEPLNTGSMSFITKNSTGVVTVPLKNIFKKEAVDRFVHFTGRRNGSKKLKTLKLRTNTCIWVSTMNAFSSQ